MVNAPESIVERIRAVKGVLAATARTQKDCLMPGYEVRVAVETARREGVMTLPIESVRTNRKGHYEVLKVVGGRIHITPVVVGIKNRQKVEIVKGLNEGDVVVKDAGMDLRDGARVKYNADEY